MGVKIALSLSIFAGSQIGARFPRGDVTRSIHVRYAGVGKHFGVREDLS
jgi:hypothetical protein